MNNEDNKTIKVFISYSQDSDKHKNRVLGLSERLRKDGLNCLIDLYYSEGPIEGWPLWMQRKIQESDFVLIVCTKKYIQKLECNENNETGHGVSWEGKLIYNELYFSKLQTKKFLPVIFDPSDKKYIPQPLLGHNYFALTSEKQYIKLYRKLTNQSEYVPTNVGKIKDLPPNKISEANTAFLATNLFKKLLLSTIVILSFFLIYIFYFKSSEVGFKLLLIYRSKVKNIDLYINKNWQWFDIAIKSFSLMNNENPQLEYSDKLSDYKAIDLNTDKQIQVTETANNLQTDKLLLVYYDDYKKMWFFSEKVARYLII